MLCVLSVEDGICENLLVTSLTLLLTLLTSDCGRDKLADE